MAGNFRDRNAYNVTTRRYFVVVGGRAASLAVARSVLWSRRSQQAPAARMPSRLKPMAPVRRAKTPDRYKVGDAEITTSYHGIWEKVHDAQYVGNATVAETKQGWANAGLTTEFVPNPITAFAVKLNSKLILCDAGGGGTRVPPVRGMTQHSSCGLSRAAGTRCD